MDLTLFISILAFFPLAQAASEHRPAETLDAGSKGITDNIVAYYINTNAEDGRRMHMENQARAAQMQLTRFEAIDRALISQGLFDEKYVFHQGLNNELKTEEWQKDHATNATVACYVSHCELLESLQRKLRPGQIALVMEDDVEIPSDWLQLLSRTLQCAPEDWSLLKVSGWGYNRHEDLQQKQEKPGALAESTVNISNMSDTNLMGWLQSHGGLLSRMLYGEPQTHPARIMRSGSSLLQSQDQSNAASTIRVRIGTEDGGSREAAFKVNVHDPDGCPDAYLMRGPFKETVWWHFWGPVFHYAGTGAYLVKAESIPSILSHLRKQPIDDIDGMLLSEGDLRAYELWPHVFPLTDDHTKSTLRPKRNPNEDKGFLWRLSRMFPAATDTEGESQDEKNGSKKVVPTSPAVASPSKHSGRMSISISDSATVTTA
eukprot:CAMPEP_0197654940 /NCGR_PEP_ID=MMETSP1338-20131121/39151_1 /TAXON_ID=43686 ORGANISM="Pelagodinium beii, Strain RCC1491" /NCGR_SAMPLE_ID=MMETSP1338 /ASSEMBLY_ACC=CAM_ASM_000754 /LENGTH=430 /DNA_ID=CAMNT_0043230483 /DNA_START=100 /DNA_END=1392 /DNA_ORIENTATION=+